jgi:hypothetical protein
MSILVGELTLSNEHQLRMKEIEYLEVAKRSSDLFTTQLEGGTIKLYYTYQSFISLPPTLPSSLYSPSHSIPFSLPSSLSPFTPSHTPSTDNSLFLDTVNSKRAMEQAFQTRMTALGERNASELVSIESKARAKVITEENRHAVLVRDTEETNRRWDEENKTLVSSHQKHLKEMAAAYETKLKAEKTLQKETMKAKELLQVRDCSVLFTSIGDISVQIKGIK